MIGFIYSRLSVENKLLLEAFQKKGVEVEKIVDGNLSFGLEGMPEYDGVLNRSISYSRALYLSKIFENCGVINSYDTIRVCGDKILTSLELKRNGLRTPETRIAFSCESALEKIEELGYPVVIKPAIGSWGRLVNKINDRESAEAILESRERLGNFYHKIYYLQEYIEKNGRDIRAFVVGDEVVGAIYRYSDSWITNTARGGRTENCEVDKELEEVCLKAAEAVGGGILGVELMENNGYVMNEVNHSTEFRNSIEPTGVDIPGKMVEYVVSEARR